MADWERCRTLLQPGGEDIARQQMFSQLASEDKHAYDFENNQRQPQLSNGYQAGDAGSNLLSQNKIASQHNNNGKRWLPSQPHLLLLSYSCIVRSSWLTPIAHNGTYLCDGSQDGLLFKLTDKQSGIWKIYSFHNDQNVLACKAQVHLQD